MYFKSLNILFGILLIYFVIEALKNGKTTITSRLIKTEENKYFVSKANNEHQNIYSNCNKVWHEDRGTKNTSLSSSENAVSEKRELSLDELIRRQELNEAGDDKLKSSLIRRRRYLVFPEGSSLQVVFCLTYFSIIPIADIFYLGATASLAWELPQDPYSPFDHKGEALNRKDEEPGQYKDVKGSHKINTIGNRILINKYTGEPIQPFAKEYYNKKYKKYPFETKEKIIEKPKESNRQPKHSRLKIKPVFAKRSTDNDNLKNNGRKASLDIKAMHLEQEDRRHLKADSMDINVVEFHRRSRRGLFEKLERLINGMGHSGRDCVLKALCEVGQDSGGRQGSFLEEIMRVIFTLPKGDEFEENNHRSYDEAHSSQENCTEIYSKCTFSIKTMPIG